MGGAGGFACRGLWLWAGRASKRGMRGLPRPPPGPARAGGGAFPNRVRYMVEGGKRDAPIPASGDGAGRAEGGAAPGSHRRETASGRIEERGPSRQQRGRGYGGDGV